MCGHSLIHGMDVASRNRREMVEQMEMSDNTTAQTSSVERTCPTCKTTLQDDYVFCPKCGTELLKACPSCHRAVEATWQNCAYCGESLASA